MTILRVSNLDVDKVCELLSTSECKLMKHFIRKLNRLAEMKTTSDDDKIIQQQCEVISLIMKYFGAVFLSELNLVDKNASENKYLLIPENSDEPKFEFYLLKLKNGYFAFSAYSTNTDNNNFEIYFISKDYEKVKRVFNESLSLIKVI